ncbi:MAG TPA: tryptophan--tRNA ligase [Syntrophobacteraceae bacterium]|nr:tryptophan--tRNA ligase [Syntrophobacteraceae bacterium]
MEEDVKRPKRILTGDRPTGRLHLGHWVGSLEARVRLQYEYETIVLVADLHMLTTKRSRQDIRQILPNTRGLVLDYLASGIDPDRSLIYLQSAVQEAHELHTYLENLLTVNRLLRLPSIKQMAQDANIGDESLPFGLLGYPVLQAADILLARAHLVPVGKDNLAHVEITRELARQFNLTYGPVFPEPEPLLSNTAALVGTDNRGKMSKSAGNAIFLSDDEQTVADKVKAMFTDPKRIHADIPGTVEGNPVFVYHRIFNADPSEVDDLEMRYRAGKVGDREVKEKLAFALNRFLTPFRERMAVYRSKPALVDEIIWNGTLKMRQIAAETMRQVRAKMGIDRIWKDIYG